MKNRFLRKFIFVQNRILQDIEQPRIKRKWLGIVGCLALGASIPDSWKKIEFNYVRNNSLDLFPTQFFPIHLNLKILRCHDGDTCTGENEHQLKYTLRLQGVDAPELSFQGKKGQIFAQEAKEFIERLIRGKTIKVTLTGTDRYRRYLALLVAPEKKNVSGTFNEEIISQGFAYAYTGQGQDSNIQKWASAAQKIAQRESRGFWALPLKPEDPRDFRQKQK